MRRLPKNALWIALLGAISLVLAWELVPLPDASMRLERFAKAGLDYGSRVIPPTPTEQEVFAGAQMVKRLVSWRGGVPFVLTVIDGTRNRHAIHDPIYCFRGAGWRVIARQHLALPGGRACWVRLRPERPDSNIEAETEAVYYFSDGVRRYDDPLRYWGAATLRRLTLGLSGAEPTLVILQPATDRRGETPDWEVLLNGFAAIAEI